MTLFGLIIVLYGVFILTWCALKLWIMQQWLQVQRNSNSKLKKHWNSHHVHAGNQSTQRLIKATKCSKLISIQPNMHGWSLFYKRVLHHSTIVLWVWWKVPQLLMAVCHPAELPLTGGGLESPSLGGSSLRAEGGILGGPAVDSWTGSNFGGSSLSFWSISTNCWKSAKEVWCLELPSSANSCISLFLFLLPVTISAPSTICGTLSGEVTKLPASTFGVLLAIFTSSPTWKGSVSCTNLVWFGARPNMLMDCGDACVPVGANKVRIYIINDLSYYICMRRYSEVDFWRGGYRLPCTLQAVTSPVSRKVLIVNIVDLCGWGMRVGRSVQPTKVAFFWTDSSLLHPNLQMVLVCLARQV